MSSLTIMLLTYNRLEYAKKTLESVLANICWSGELRLHIASDGDTPEYFRELLDLTKGPKLAGVSLSNSERGGYGMNYNLALQTVHQYSEYVLPLEDDWELLRPLNANMMVDALDALGAGCMRLGYMGFTQAVRCTVATALGKYWLRLDQNSEEPHIFAGHPRIETRAWQRRVGPWPEGLLPGETEFSVAHLPEARQGIVWPIDEVRLCGDLFGHIGTERSY